MTEPLFAHPEYGKFATGFFERHLEEIDFLVDQRGVFFHDPAIAWPSVERLDDRIRAHAAALGAWGDGARAFTRGQLEAAETALPAAYVLATLGTDDDAAAAVDALNTAPPEVLPRLVLGLSLARGPDLVPRLTALAASPRGEVRAAAARILGSRQHVRAGALADLLLDGDPAVQAAAARACAALGLREMAPALERCASEAPGPFLWPLVELGSRQATALCRRALSTGEGVSDETFLALAVAGEPSDAALLRAAEITPRSVHALGVLGAAASVPWLISTLGAGDEDVSAAAGAALWRITGAPLRETVEVPEPADETAPRPRAHHVERPSTSRAAWDRWWMSHRGALDERARHRGGAPYSVRASVEEVTAPLTPLADRRRAAAEIRHHTRTAATLDPEGWIHEQHVVLREWQSL